MSRRVTLNNGPRLMVALLCFCLTTPICGTAFTEVNSQSASLTQNASQTASKSPPVNEEFKFGKVDLELLEQVNILDRRFESEGIVLEDEATNAYLKRIGDVLISRDLKLENVVWKFRALRDRVP